MTSHFGTLLVSFPAAYLLVESVLVYVFTIRTSNVSLSLDILNCFGFEPWIILKLFLNIEGVTTSEDQKIIFKSLLVSYFTLKQNKVEQNNRYFIDREKVNLQAVFTQIHTNSKSC